MYWQTGIGRTGTVLAAWLVCEGLTAPKAQRRVRLIHSQYVQTTEQEDFLQHCEDAILPKIPWIHLSANQGNTQ